MLTRFNSGDISGCLPSPVHLPTQWPYPPGLRLDSEEQ